MPVDLARRTGPVPAGRDPFGHASAGSPGSYVMWPTGYPDFPMPQQLRTDRAAGRVTVSCQVSDIDVCWQLSERAGGTAIDVRVELPEAEAHRVAGQRDAISRSLRRLAELASAG